MWQPIETAPKDGRRIWLYFPDWKSTAPCRWTLNGYRTGFAWTLDSQEDAELNYDPPSHWMPLPLSPEAQDDILQTAATAAKEACIAAINGIGCVYFAPETDEDWRLVVKAVLESVHCTSLPPPHQETQ